MSENWPNFFIVGAPKSGTTTLYEYLNKIPGIYMSPVKEPNYFSLKTVNRRNHPLLNPIRDKKKYLDLFKNVKGEKIFGEASTSYLADPDAPGLIQHISPDARILISLRDPVERLFSNYLMQVRNGVLKSSFHKELQNSLKPNKSDVPNLRLFRSLYLDSIMRYFKNFGPDQVKIIIFEEWIKNPKKTMEEILKFLGIKEFFTNFEENVYNPYVVPKGTMSQHMLTNKALRKVANKTLPPSIRRNLKNLIVKEQIKPKMNPEDMQVLIKYYHDDVKKLENILERKLLWKNFKS